MIMYDFYNSEILVIKEFNNFDDIKEAFESVHPKENEKPTTKK